MKNFKLHPDQTPRPDSPTNPTILESISTGMQARVNYNVDNTCTLTLAEPGYSFLSMDTEPIISFLTLVFLRQEHIPLETTLVSQGWKILQF